MAVMAVMVYQSSTCFQEGLAGPSKPTEAHEWGPRIQSGEQDHLRKEEPVCHIILPLGPLGNWLEHLEMISMKSSGWWLTYPSEKYEFVSWDDYPIYSGQIKNWLVVWTVLKNISKLGLLFPIYGKIKCSKPPTSGGCFQDSKLAILKDSQRFSDSMNSNGFSLRRDSRPVETVQYIQ